MRRTILCLIAILFATPAAFSQQFKYEKYTLPNGMTVILHEDHALPVVVINTWYRVGAKDELPGRSGFAHLFEHLMFMGTTRVPGSDFDNLMEAGGGSNNASTDFDRTNYYSSGPSSLLPTLLWLDADRLEDLGRTMSKEKLDKQRDVVRNEIRQQVENTPYRRAGEDIYRLMYPEGHPYHNAVYGTHEDLEASTVDNVRDFFATYYVPNNASLVVSGDFESAKVKPMVDALFGTIARGEPVDHKTAPQPRLAHAIHKTMLDKVQLPLIKMVWHSPPGYAEGDAELDLLAAVLSQGKNSRLYKRLVFEEKLAVDVSASQDSQGLGSLFVIDVTAKPDSPLDRVEAIVDEELGRITAQGPEQRELEERKATVEMAMLAQLQSGLAVADKLNEYEYHFGEPDSFKRDLDRYRGATPHGVREWARKVLVPERLVMRVLPEEPERAQSARDNRPADFSKPAFEPAAPTSFTLKNGLRVMLWSKPELPLVAADLIFRPGAPLYDPHHAGLPALTASMLEEGAGELDSLSFASALQMLGAHLNASAGQESASVSLLTLRRTFDRAAGLFADAVRRPRLQASDWDRVKSIHLEELKQQDEEPTIVAARVGLRTLFGDANPYAWPNEGTPELVEKYTLDDVKREHARIFRPDTATLLVAGAITEAEAKGTLERVFGDWNAAASSAPAPSAGELKAVSSGALRLVIVDRPGAVQTVIRYMTPAPTYKTENRVPLALLNTLLGGSFTSRLNQNLREAHGYTYGARSRFALEPSTGYFMASSSVRSDVTGASLTEFAREFARLRGGDVSAPEAGKARETLRTDTVQSFEGLSGLLRAAAVTVVNDVPFTTIADDLKRAESVSDDDLNALAKSALPIDTGVLVLVGDRKTIEAQIADLKLPTPIHADVRGNRVPATATPDKILP